MAEQESHSKVDDFIKVNTGSMNRGGGWISNVTCPRAGTRYNFVFSGRLASIGFRVCRPRVCRPYVLTKTIQRWQQETEGGLFED